MKILLSNDDGVFAKGLEVLAAELSKIAIVSVIAPDRDRSGASNSLSLSRPIRPRTMHNGFVCLDGTPTDCVHLGVTGLLDELPDMVVAGVNSGANLGDDIFYSGTVAAAMEGRFLGLPAMAVSLVRREQDFTHYETAAKIVRDMVLRLRNNPLPSKTILNINVPDLPLQELTGIEITRLGSRHIAEPMIKMHDPRGHTVYWVGSAGPEEDAGPGTDFHAVNTGAVSITPIELDLTNYKAFQQISDWVSDFNFKGLE